MRCAIHLSLRKGELSGVFPVNEQAKMPDRCIRGEAMMPSSGKLLTHWLFFATLPVPISCSERDYPSSGQQRGEKHERANDIWNAALGRGHCDQTQSVFCAGNIGTPPGGYTEPKSDP